MDKLLLFIILLQSLILSGNTYQVGSNKAYVSPNALYLANVIQHGDTIEIDAEDYLGMASLAVWSPDELLIRGVGEKPHLIANGEYIWGKGIWVCSGDNITIENIEFSGAVVPDQNGAGIRLDGLGLTVRNCYFHDNENGILTGNPFDGDILVEYTEFSNNGHGDGFSHNLYIGHVNKLTFQYNYSHHAKIGHALKSRANENYILYNRLMDEESGTSSRLIDLSNGGFSIIMGNVLMQGALAENNNMIGYGKEGLSNTSNHEIYCVNNTFVNKRMTCLFVDVKNGTSVSVVSNNIFAGIGTLFSDPVSTSNNNLVDENIADIGFMDESNYDYRLMSASSSIDYGNALADIDGFSLTPVFVYLHPLGKGTRIIYNNIDAGAYEYGEMVGLEDNGFNKILLYPNPTVDFIYIKNDRELIKRLSIISQKGEHMSVHTDSEKIDLSACPDGIYYILIEKYGKPSSLVKILKM